MSTLPRIAITMGDPAGVGPELCLRLLAEKRVREYCVPIIHGDANILKRVAKHLGWPAPARQDVLHLGGETASGFLPAQVSPECGAAAYRYFTTATAEALAGR